MSPSFRQNTTQTPRRFRVKSIATKSHGQYWEFTHENSDPPYHMLAATMEAVRRPPAAQAFSRLNGMTAVNANWQALGSAPPNEKAKRLALQVLEASYSMDIIEPSLVTASAEGGVGVVYKAPGRYAAIECLNSGVMQLLWFDEGQLPQSRRIKDTKKAIGEALKQVASIHARA